MLAMCIQVPSYLLDEPLAESRRDPLPGVDSTVHEDGGLGGAGLLTELKVKIKHLLDGTGGIRIRKFSTNVAVLTYLEDSHGATLVGASNHLPADQTRVGGGNGSDPGLDLKLKVEIISK